MISKLPQKNRITLGIALLAILAVIGFAHIKSNSLIPGSIQKQLTFPVLITPRTAGTFHIDKQSIKYYKQDKDTYIFSFIVKSPGNSVTFTEQPYPETLIYDKLVGALQQYDEIQTIYGKVALTRPKDQGGLQTAVLKTDDTLIFAKPTQNLPNSDWQSLFNSLKQIR